MCQAKLEKRHPFSLTLGEGPYRYVGFFDLGEAVKHQQIHGDTTRAFANAPKLVSGMGTCSHCGRAISNVCVVEIGDGKLYGVGPDCIRKVSAEGLVSAVSEMERTIREIQRQARADREKSLKESLTKDFNAALQVLENKQHPNAHFAKQGKTAADYYRYIGKTSYNMQRAIREAKVIS